MRAVNGQRDVFEVILTGCNVSAPARVRPLTLASECPDGSLPREFDPALAALEALLNQRSSQKRQPGGCLA